MLYAVEFYLYPTVSTFESLGTVSYSPSIVTMAVCLAISGIFSVKEWRDLGNQVSVAGPLVWNFIADCLRDPALELASFKRQLKTFLFARY